MPGLLDRFDEAMNGDGLLSQGPQSVGRLPDGRVIVKNEAGSERGPGFSTRYQITEKTPWGWMNIPTLFNGMQVEPAKAVDIIMQNGGIDPDTGYALPTFGSLDEAETAAKRLSSGTDFYLDQALSAPLGSKVRMGIMGD